MQTNALEGLGANFAVRVRLVRDLGMAPKGLGRKKKDKDTKAKGETDEMTKDKTKDKTKDQTNDNAEGKITDKTNDKS